MSVIKDHILKAAGKHFLQGDSFRMHHSHKSDGSVCSKPTDDPSMVVTRVSNGWVFYCHRCTCSGTITDTRLSPGQTRKRVDALKKVPINKDVKTITLPWDFYAMNTKVDHDPVPWEAYHWLWKYGLSAKEMMKFGIGWSATYKRVIIPIHEFIYTKDAVMKQLVGWVGREVKYKNKKARKEAGIPKYLTRSQKDKRRYFVAPGDREHIVLCEDCISAIKVNLATGYTAMALLQTDVGDDLLRMLRGMKVYVWLDGNMLAKSVHIVDRMRQLGLDAKRIYTPKDPKEYNLQYISNTVKGEEKDDADSN